jgi:hypothetical protein
LPQLTVQDSPAAGKARWHSQLFPLSLGALAGLVLAATGLVDHWSLPNGKAGGTLPRSAIARVGERDIPRSRYIQLLSDLETDKHGPLTAEDRKFVLDRLVDEELLILRGVELGLDESAPSVRKAIAAAVIAQVAAESEATPPDEEALRELYQSDPQFFASADRYALRWWQIPASAASPALIARISTLQADASNAREVLDGPGGLVRMTVLPQQMLPLSKVADYLGSELAQRVPQLEPGHYSSPIESDGNINILLLVDHQAGTLTSFEQLRPVLEAEYHRRSGDKALRDYLAWLRERIPVTVDADPGD